MLTKIKSIITRAFAAIIRSREAKARAYVEFYKKHGYGPFYDA